MFKKLLIAVAAGALLLPVGLALSNTGGKGLIHGGSKQHCSYYAKKRAHAAGGVTHVKKCVVVVKKTVTKTRTVNVPVTVTRTNNHTTTTTRNYTVTRTT